MNPNNPLVKEVKVLGTVNNLKNQVDSFNQFSDTTVSVQRVGQKSEFFKDELRIDLVPRSTYNVGPRSTLHCFLAFRIDGHAIAVDRPLNLELSLELDTTKIYPDAISIAPGNQDPVRPELYHDIWIQAWFEFTWQGHVAPLTALLTFFVVPSPPSAVMTYIFNVVSTRRLIPPPKDSFVYSTDALSALDWVGDELPSLFTAQ